MKAPARDVADVIVVGAGAAGAMAAIRARQLELSAILVDRSHPARERPCAGWIGPAGVALVESCGVTARSVQARTFSGLSLHSWDFRRSTRVSDSDLTGWLVDRTQFDAKLVERAAKCGATIERGAETRGLRMGESQATVQLAGGRECTARILLIADGADSPTARMANLLPAGALPGGAICLYGEASIGGTTSGLDVALGASRSGSIATLVRVAGQARLSLCARDADAARADAFRALWADAASAKLLPDVAAPTPRRFALPTGCALDIESHVGKRCLLLGDAGGFVASFSMEGIYPAMRSGWIAAEVAARALAAPVVQDELARFGVTWRSELGEYLRMPNTDLSLLLPLVFSNEQMSRRVARAFLLGQAF